MFFENLNLLRIGFSRDICGILLIANITRCFYWLGSHFEIALLVQSILMIVAQVIMVLFYDVHPL